MGVWGHLDAEVVEARDSSKGPKGEVGRRVLQVVLVEAT